MYHSNLNIIKTTIPNIDSSEIVFIHLKNSEQISLKIILIYRPPNNDIQTFISDFNNIIIPNITTNTIILGDFNIHINKKTCIFNKILERNNLHQHITFPTHIHGNILDLLITYEQNNIVNTITQSDIFSDHYAIKFKINIAKPEQRITKLTYRAISKINYIQLCKDIDYHILNNEYDVIIVDKLMAGISYCLNIHAPLKQKLIIERPKNLWYNAKLAKSKQTLRNIE